MSYTISTLLTRNLNDVFGENDPARRRAAIDEIFTEDCVFYEPRGVYRGRDEIDRVAGRGLYGDFLDQPLDTVRTMIDLNLTVVTELTHLFARDMVRRKTGHILVIASILGYQPTPGYVVYGATKAYVLLFGESLHAELKKHNVNVTVLSPGPAETSFAHVAGQRNTFVLRALMMEPEAVARTGIRAMLQRRSSVVAGLLSKLVIVSNRLTPRFVQGLIMQRALSG
jgi:short-subunit dehydrogenase